MIDFEKDADALKLQDDDIEGIAGLAKRAKELEKEVDDLEQVVKERKDKLLLHLKKYLKIVVNFQGYLAFCFIIFFSSGGI